VLKYWQENFAEILARSLIWVIIIPNSSGEVLRSFEAEANTNEMCFHPEDNNIFLAAESSFGAVTQFDLRSPTGIVWS
jgi:hypothetical protein